MHAFNTIEEKYTLLYCFIYLHACQLERSMWDNIEYGMERTNALRYVERTVERTDWTKAYPAIVLYAPRLVEFARRDCKEFVEKYAAQDADYLGQPQIYAILRMLEKMNRSRDVEKTTPLLAPPPKVKKPKKK